LNIQGGKKEKINEYARGKTTEKNEFSRRKNGLSKNEYARWKKKSVNEYTFRKTGKTNFL
jgi:hypothetical protein